MCESRPNISKNAHIHKFLLNYAYYPNADKYVFHLRLLSPKFQIPISLMKNLVWFFLFAFNCLCLNLFKFLNENEGFWNCVYYTLSSSVMKLKISVIRKREVGVKKSKNKIRLYSLYIYLKYSCRIPIKIFIDFLFTLIVFITCLFSLISTLFCSRFFFLWPLHWHHPFFLLLPLSWPYFDGSLKYYFDDLFYFLGSIDFCI